jgi:hypothetical protein
MTRCRKPPSAAFWASAVLVVGLIVYMAGISFLFPTLCVAFAAFCIWLSVRIVNQDRWAKRTLVWLAVSIPVLYVLGIGPAAKIAQITGAYWLMLPYSPILWLADASGTIGTIVAVYCMIWGVYFE